MIVEIVKRFKKDFKSAPGDIQRRVLEMINALENAEKLEKSGLDVRAMEGQKKGEHYYRIQIGDWRVGCEYLYPDIILLRLMSRGDVYKQFPPK